ncbi:MAG TPA: TonB family protein [Nitrospiraceae bacterium]|nr:TonB family protein [Nitrospiraceae bacterium]
MSVGTYPNLFVVSAERRAILGQRLGSMLALSLALHALLLMVVAGLRLPAKVERPLSSYEVSLVTLPTPQRVETPQATPPREPQPVPRVTPPVQAPLKKVEPQHEKSTLQPKEPPVTMTPKPAPQPLTRAQENKSVTAPTSRLPAAPQPAVKAPESRSVPIPSPPVKTAPQPAPPMIKVPEYKPVPLPASPSSRKTLDREILRGVTLPPEAPKFSEVSPISGESPKETNDSTPTQKDIKKLLGNLNVPEPAMPAVPSPPKQIAQPLKSVPVRPSVTEELSQLNKLNERLQNEYKQREHVEAPRQVAQARSIAPPPPQAVPQVTKTSLKNPLTKIQAISSSGPGANQYLQRIQQLISSRWSPHQVDPTIESFRVIVKFRLNRDGKVDSVKVEQTSGNGYFDDAGVRAVVSGSLPGFPPEMSDQYLDAHFSFLVGEQAS